MLLEMGIKDGTGELRGHTRTMHIPSWHLGITRARPVIPHSLTHYPRIRPHSAFPSQPPAIPKKGRKREKNAKNPRQGQHSQANLTFPSSQQSLGLLQAWSNGDRKPESHEHILGFPPQNEAQPEPIPADPDPPLHPNTVPEGPA